MKQKTKIVVGLAAACAAAAAIAAGVWLNRVVITGVTLPPTVDIVKGETAALAPAYTTERETTPEKLADAAAKLPLAWASGDETVAAVDAAGSVTAVGPGEADVTLTAGEGLQAVCHVTVRVPLEAVTAKAALALVTNGEAAASVEAALQPADATDVALTYKSSDESVATVDKDGGVTAVGNGTCTVTAAAGDKNAQTAVTVTTLCESVTLDKTEGILYVGSAHTVKATVLPETASRPELSWASSDESIATVDGDGRVTAKKAGKATITATTADGKAQAAYVLTVQNKPKPVTPKTAAGTVSSGAAAPSAGDSGGAPSDGGGSSGDPGGSPPQTFETLPDGTVNAVVPGNAETDWEQFKDHIAPPIP